MVCTLKRCVFSWKVGFWLIAAIWANLFEHLCYEMAAEPPFHNAQLLQIPLRMSSCFHKGWEGTFSAIVQEHWWIVGYSERWFFNFHSHLHQSSRTVRGGGYCTYSTSPFITKTYRLNIEVDLQSLFGLLCIQLYSWLRPRNSPLPPHIRGRYWSAKVDDISL